jgi:hypothetical protein
MVEFSNNSANPYESPREVSPVARRSLYWLTWFAAVFLFGAVAGFFAGYSLGLHDGTVKGMHDLDEWASQ